MDVWPLICTKFDHVHEFCHFIIIHDCASKGVAIVPFTWPVVFATNVPCQIIWTAHWSCADWHWSPSHIWNALHWAFMLIISGYASFPIFKCIIYCFCFLQFVWICQNVSYSHLTASLTLASRINYWSIYTWYCDYRTVWVLANVYIHAWFL